MGTSNYSDEFKRDAVHQIRVRGYPVREVSQRLGVSTHSCLIPDPASWVLEATARHAIYGGQWRRLDRRLSGLLDRCRVRSVAAFTLGLNGYACLRHG